MSGYYASGDDANTGADYQVGNLTPRRRSDSKRVGVHKLNPSEFENVDKFQIFKEALKSQERAEKENLLKDVRGNIQNIPFILEVILAGKDVEKNIKSVTAIVAKAEKYGLLQYLHEKCKNHVAGRSTTLGINEATPQFVFGSLLEKHPQLSAAFSPSFQDVLKCATRERVKYTPKGMYQHHACEM